MTSSVSNSRREQFPRTADLPSQTPLFWVQQKDRYLRQVLIRDIQEATGRTLLVYFANRFEQGSDIDHRDCSLFAELFRDAGNGPVDLLLETNGGNTDAAESIISFIGNRTADLRVIVANAAKSNGTLIALMAREIVMGPTSELGPIEPSVNGIPSSILTQPEVAAGNFPLHKLGQFALQQTKAMATKLLKAGMLAGRDDTSVNQVVQTLATRDTFASHGSAIDSREAAALGLAINQLSHDDDLWKRIWLLHCMYAHDCTKSRYLKVFEGPFTSTAIGMPITPTPGT